MRFRGSLCFVSSLRDLSGVWSAVVRRCCRREELNDFRGKGFHKQNVINAAFFCYMYVLCVVIWFLEKILIECYFVAGLGCW